jgi:hypothetical protein
MQSQLLFTVLLSFSALAMAHDSKKVPNPEDYLPNCFDQAKASSPGGVFGSTIDAQIAAAFCECKFEHFPTNGWMTKNQFFSSALVCKREQEHDLLEFTKKYVSRFRERNKSQK